MTQRIREKPHRLPRETYLGQATVSFTICVAHRAPLFTDAGVVGAFLDVLRSVAQHWSCVVVVYCFMPDHLHLVLHGTTHEADLWKMVVDFKQRSGYWLYRHMPRVVWQKDFYDHVIREDDDLAVHVRYVLDNPCRKGLVNDWEEYPFKGSIGCELEDVLVGLPL